MTDRRADATESGVQTAGTRRRAVLAGMTGVVGATLGISGVAAAGDVAPNPAPTCDPGCVARLKCCVFEGEDCTRRCWYCDCS